MNVQGLSAQRIKVQARGLLFDMDGVLISSLGSVERSWSTWAERHGLDVRETIKTAHGMRAIETLRRLRPDADLATELKAIEDLEIGDTADIRILEGVVPMLQALPKNCWAIVTSATDRLARRRLDVAGIPVPEYMVTGDAVTHGKPHPEPYRKGAELLHLAPSDCIVVEDSSSGAKAGHEAGCRVLATTFSHGVEELSAADWIVESLGRVKVRLIPGSRLLELEFEVVAQ